MPPNKPLVKKTISYPVNENWRWISTADLIQTTVTKLLPQLPPDISGIVGVTRSGMLPAAALSTHLHLPLWSVSQHHGEPIPLASGSRGVGKADGPLLIVDDTVYSGTALGMLRGRLRGDYLFAAVYARPEKSDVCDFFGSTLSSPHLLEWNLMNSGPLVGQAINPAMKGGVALDFDGIVCTNENAQPLLLPRRSPVPLVITGREERDREATLAWCAKWGVKIQKLVMRQPNDDRDIPTYKAEEYKASGCSLYIESEPDQAEKIAELSGKPVACPASRNVYMSAKKVLGPETPFKSKKPIITPQQAKALNQRIQQAKANRRPCGCGAKKKV